MSAENVINIKLLGVAYIETGSELVSFTKMRPAFAILSYVLANKYHIPREKLYKWLWSNEDKEKQQSNFRYQIGELKKVVPAICTNRYNVWLETDANISLDIHTFEQLCKQKDNIPALKEAIALYRGPYLEGVDLSDSPEAEQWLKNERDYWERRYIQTLEILVKALLAQDQLDEATDYLDKWLTVDWDNEQVHRLKMRTLVQQGYWQKATIYYQTYAKKLKTELKLQPTLETRQLATRIQHASYRHRHQLPANPKQFIGREEEIAIIKDYLAHPDYRFLSITGPGGIGKTRLALEIARAKQNAFIEGVYFVRLTNVTNSQIMALSIANEMLLSFQGRQYFARHLANVISEQEILLILDNFEHLHEHRNFVTELLKHTKNLKIIVTSRFQLNLENEQNTRLEGLPISSKDQVSPAIQLFIQSGQRVNPEFQLSPDNHDAIVKICEIVTGLPLGIELAASWVRILSCDEILEEIEESLDFIANPQSDLPERHSSIQALFYSSWKLLTKKEQALLRRLAVFTGTFDQKAAQVILQTTPYDLANLVDRSLLMVTNNYRYYLHGLIAPYLSRILTENIDEWEQVHLAHAKYYAGYIESHISESRWQMLEWQHIDDVGKELDNCLTAWRWVIQNRSWQLLDSMLQRLFRFYKQTGQWQDAVRWLDELLAELITHPRLDSALKPNHHAKYAGISLTKQGYFHCLLGNLNEAEQCLKQGLPHLYNHGTLQECAQAETWLSDTFYRQQKWQEANQHIQLAHRAYLRLEDSQGINLCITFLALISAEQGDDDAENYFGQLMEQS